MCTPSACSLWEATQATVACFSFLTFGMCTGTYHWLLNVQLLAQQVAQEIHVDLIICVAVWRHGLKSFVKQNKWTGMNLENYSAKLSLGIRSLEKEEICPSWHPFRNTTIPQKDHLKSELPALSHFISPKATYLHCSLCPVSLVGEVIVYECQRLHMSRCYLSKQKPEFTCPWATKSRLLLKFSCRLCIATCWTHFTSFLFNYLLSVVFVHWMISRRENIHIMVFPWVFICSSWS